jgi:hypothetical protein
MVYAYILFLLVSVHVGLVLSGFSPVLTGEMPDTDAYTRILRVLDLINGQDWFDSTMMRMNAPYGDVLNWTRPLDVLMIAVAWPFHALGQAWPQAVYNGGIILPPLLHILFAVSVVWMAAPLLPARSGPLLLLLVAVQPLVLIYNIAGRPDHQTLLFICTAITLGYALRVLERKALSGLHAGFIAGLWTGFGLWVSCEYQFVLAVQLAFLVPYWWWSGRGDVLRFLEGLALGALIMGVAAVGAERGTEWAAVRELDKISLSQLIGLIIHCAFWGLLATYAGRGQRFWRGIALLAASAAALAALVFFAPELLRGPAGDIDPQVMTRFFLHIREMGALLPLSLSDTADMMLIIGPCLWAFLLWDVFAWRTHRRPAWVLLLVFSLAFTLMGMMHARFAQFAEPYSVVFLVAVLVTQEGRLARLNLPLRVLSAAGLILAPFIVAVGLMAAIPEETAKEEEGGRCYIRPVSAQLNKLPEGIVMASLNLGPELLYFTHHGVIAGPYHRNTRGLLDSIGFFSDMSDSEAIRILRARGVRYVLACLESDSTPDTRAYRLISGKIPAWLTPLPLEPDYSTLPSSQKTAPMRLFEVNIKAGAGGPTP